MTEDKTPPAHTPTPWTVKGLEGDDTPMTEVIDSNGMLICSTEGQGIDLTHTEANAKLIAKCVNSHDELLEACEQSQDLLMRITVEDMPEDEIKYIEEIDRMLNVAISKARGQ